MTVMEGKGLFWAEIDSATRADRHHLAHQCAALGDLLAKT